MTKPAANEGVVQSDSGLCESLRVVGGEFIADDIVYQVVRHVIASSMEPVSPDHPNASAELEPVGRCTGGYKRYFDGRVVYVPDWTI